MTKLSALQQQVVSQNDGAILVVAGPGSGKTRVLTARLRRLLAEVSGHYRILALTFTNKAANEMKERLAEFPNIEQRAFLGTFHSFCLDVLATRGEAVGIAGVPTVFESYQDRKQVLQQAAMEDPLLRSELESISDTKEQSKRLSYWLDTVSTLKASLLLPDAVEDPLLKRVYAAYSSGLRASSACDFDDMLLLTYRLFTEKPKVADFFRRQYRFILVDEAQDLNEAQYRVLQALCGETYNNVMLVGDPKQAIFVWNGADPKYLELFQRDFSAKRIELKENFRCSRKVVEAARKLAPEYTVVGQLPIAGAVELIEGTDEENEAEQVLKKLSSLVSSGHPDIEGPITMERCAILARNRYVFGALEEKLKSRSVSYHKQVSIQEEFESDLMINFNLCLRIIANPNDILHLNSLTKRLGVKNISGAQKQNLSAVFKAVRNPDAELLVLKDATTKLMAPQLSMNAAIAILEARVADEQNESVKELQLKDLAELKLRWGVYIRSAPGGSQSVGGFLSEVALGRTQPAKRDGLALLSIHAAKGLEFDVVFIMGMADGTFPDYRAKGPAAVEERRNAFVAVTRSRRLLFCSYPKMKQMPWGDLRLQKKSEFLSLMGL
jgi:DNA helicase-2/ATP-dependent DNA helicase PcrA